MKRTFLPSLTALLLLILAMALTGCQRDDDACGVAQQRAQEQIARATQRAEEAEGLVRDLLARVQMLRNSVDMCEQEKRQ